MRILKIAYWFFTGLMCLIFCFSATMYLINYEQVVMAYQKLGFPAWMVYPSAILKYLGIVAILSNFSKTLKEWAYAGFVFDALAATIAHIMVSDGQQMLAIIALTTTFGSRIIWAILQAK